MAKRDFDAFYYGVGMKLDEASIEKASQQIEGKLNQVVDNVTKEVKKIALAVNSGIKDIDTTGLNKAIKEVGMDLDDLVDFDPKKLKTQVGQLENDFKGLTDKIGDMSSKMETSFSNVNELITKVSTRLENIEIKTSKDGIRAFKSDLEMMADYAQKMLSSGEIDTSGIDKYLQRVKNGFASLKASGNPLEMFADKDIAKYFVNISTLLRDMGAPVEDLRVEFFELSSVFKEVFEGTNLPGAQNIFKGVKYQIEEVNHSLQKARLNIAQYEAEIAKLENDMRDWHKITDESDQALIDEFQTKQTVENLDAIIKKIDEYQSKIFSAPKDTPDIQSYERLVSLAQTAEGIISGMGKRKAKPFLTKWAEDLSGITDVEELKDYKINDFSTGFLEDYRGALQQMIDGIRNAPEYQELQKTIGEQTIKLESLIGKKSSKPASSRKGTDVTKAIGEKFVVSPELQIDAKKWTQQINDALTEISNPETGKLKPVNLRINTQKTQLEKDLNQIWKAIEDTLKGTRNVNKKDADDNPISAYETAFDSSFKSFMTKLKEAKTQLVEFVDKDWKPKLKDAFSFDMKVDGQSKTEAKKQVGAFIRSYIDALNLELEGKPIELKTNIDAIIEEIQTKAKNIKIDGGQVDFKVGNVQLPQQSIGNLMLSVDTGDLAKDDTVRKIYNLLSVRKGDGKHPLDDQIASLKKQIAEREASERSVLGIVEEKTNAEQRGAKAVERKVEVETKPTEAPKEKSVPTPKEVQKKKVKQTKETEEKKIEDKVGFDKQKIYNEVHNSIKNTLKTFKDSEAALKLVKEEAKNYSDTLKTADKNSEEFFKAEAGLTSLLHQWRSKIGLPKSAEAFKYEKNLGFKGKSGGANWQEYLKKYGIADLIPQDFKLLKETKFREVQGLEEPKSLGRVSSNKKTRKIEESAEEMIARDFKHTKEIAEHVLKMAKWAKALGAIADGMDYTLTEADFKDRDTVSRNGVTYTKQDLDANGGKIVSRGRRLTAEVLNEFVAEYENSEDEEFKELFGFVKDLIEANRASQVRLDETLKSLAGTDVATKYDAANDKAEYLSKGVKASFGRMMATNANKAAQANVQEILSKYGMLDVFQGLSSEKDPSAIFKKLQDSVLSNENFDKMVSDLAAVDGNMGKSYENFVSLLKISKEFMLTTNSLSSIGQEALKWISGTREQRDKYKKVFDPKTGRSIHTDEKVGVRNEVVEKGLRQMIQEFAAIFVDEAGNRAFGFNEGKTIVDEFLPANASFTKIIDFLERALEIAVDIQTPKNNGITKGYEGIRKHERIGEMVNTNVGSQYQVGIKSSTDADQIHTWIRNLTTRLNGESQKLLNLEKELELAVTSGTEEAIKRLQGEVEAAKNQIEKTKAAIETHQNTLKNADNVIKTYTKNGKIIDKQEAELLLPQAQTAKQYAIKELQEIKNKFAEEASSIVSEVIEKQGNATGMKFFEQIRPQLIDESFAKGNITKADYVDQLTQKYITMRNATEEADIARAKSDAKARADAQERVLQLENEIKMLNEIANLRQTMEDISYSDGPSGKSTSGKPQKPVSKSTIGANHTMMNALDNDMGEFWKMVRKSAIEIKTCNRIFREYDIGFQKGNVKSINIGSYANVKGSGAGLPLDAHAHAHPRNSLYSSQDIASIAAHKSRNKSYNTDMLITPDYMYQLNGIKNASQSALRELEQQFKYIEDKIKIDGQSLSGAFSTKIKESILANFAQNNNIKLSKYKLTSDGKMNNVSDQMNQLTSEVLDRIISQVKSSADQQVDLRDLIAGTRDPLVKQLLFDEADNKKQDASYKKIAFNASALQGAIDNNLDLKLFYNNLIELLNTIKQSGQSVPSGSVLDNIRKQVRSAQSLQNPASIMDTIRPLLVELFGTSPGNAFDDRAIDGILAGKVDKDSTGVIARLMKYDQRGGSGNYHDSGTIESIDSLESLKSTLASLEAQRDADTVDPRFATADKQQEIINILKSGIKVNGKTTSETKNSDKTADQGRQKENKKKVPKIPTVGKVDLQTEEINNLADVNKEWDVYKNYIDAKAQLSRELESAKSKGDAFTAEDADRIRATRDQVLSLGKDVIKTSESFTDLKTRSQDATSGIKIGVTDVKNEMLSMVHDRAVADKALISDIGFDDAKQRMTAVLTDMEGQSTRLTMDYYETFDAIVTRADKTTDSVRKIYKAIEGEMTKMVEAQNLIDVSGKTELGDSKEFEAYSNTYKKMLETANKIRQKGALATKEEKDELIALRKQVETTRMAFEKMFKASADFDAKVGQNVVGMNNSQSLEVQMKNYVLNSQEWSASQRRMIEETWKFSDAQNSASYAVEKNKGQLSSMSVIADMGTKRIGQYTEETKKYKSGMEKFMDSLKNKWQEVARYLMTFGSMYRVFAMLKQGVMYVKEIDSALTELKKVTDETEESYDRFLKTAAKTADKVGSTIKEIVSSTADWARIGYSLQDAATLAESTAVLLNVSEFQSIDEATSALTSTLQAFSYTAEQSMDVVDVLNEVGKLVARR